MNIGVSCFKRCSALSIMYAEADEWENAKFSFTVMCIYRRRVHKVVKRLTATHCAPIVAHILHFQGGNKSIAGWLRG